MFCAIFIVVIKNVILQFYLKFYETPDTTLFSLFISILNMVDSKNHNYGQNLLLVSAWA